MHAKEIDKFYQLLLIKIVLLFVLVTGAQGLITQAPKNRVVVLKGKTNVFMCCSNKQATIFWHHKPVGSPDPNGIYDSSGLINGYLTSGRFNVTSDHSSGCHSLITTNVSRGDEGTYICVDEAGHGERKIWELVILESFDCQERKRKAEYMGVNDFGLPQDVISIACTSEYFGNVPPKIICVWSSGTKMPDNYQHEKEANLDITLSIQMPAKKEFNGDPLFCYIESDGESSDNQTLTVRKSVKLIINHATFYQKRVSRCNADELSLDCRPECNYDKKRFSNGSSYCEIIYPLQTHQKFNVLLQENKQLLQRTTNIPSSTINPVETQTPWPGIATIALASLIAGFFGICVGVGFTILFVCCCCKRRCFPHRNTEAIEMEERRSTGNAHAPIHVGDGGIVMVNAAPNANSSLIQQHSPRCENRNTNNPEIVTLLNGLDAFARPSFEINMNEGCTTTFTDVHGLQQNTFNTKQKNKPALEEVFTVYKKKDRKSAAPYSKSE